MTAQAGQRKIAQVATTLVVRRVLVMRRVLGLLAVVDDLVIRIVRALGGVVRSRCSPAAQLWGQKDCCMHDEWYRARALCMSMKRMRSSHRHGKLLGQIREKPHLATMASPRIQTVLPLPRPRSCSVRCAGTLQRRCRGGQDWCSFCASILLMYGARSHSSARSLMGPPLVLDSTRQKLFLMRPWLVMNSTRQELLCMHTHGASEHIAVHACMLCAVCGCKASRRMPALNGSVRWDDGW